MRHFKKVFAIILALALVAGVSLAADKDAAGEKKPIESKQDDLSSEARVALGGIFTAATSYFAEMGTFEIPNIDALGYVAGKSRYSFWYAVKGVPMALPGSRRSKGPCDLTTPPTSVNVVASAKGFVAAAKGNLDDDATCDEWSINEKRELIRTMNDENK